ncbi:unnamed protein product [Diamesa serratosioi]
MQNPNIPYLLLKEEIEKQNRNSNFFHYDHFRTNLKQVPIATKFWSKYDTNMVGMDVEKHKSYLHQIDKTLDETPKTKYSEPQVESHKIGWITEPLLKMDSQDFELLHHPRVSGEITRIGEKIYAEKVTQRPKYTGHPFKLS